MYRASVVDERAMGWYDATPILSDEDRLKIGRTNAIELFKLELD